MMSVVNRTRDVAQRFDDWHMLAVATAYPLALWPVAGLDVGLTAAVLILTLVALANATDTL